MQCNKCRRDAILFQEYSGQHLCKYHVEADVEAKAKYEIRRNRWMTPGDHIAVALSGGKNSSALLYFLKKLIRNLIAAKPVNADVTNPIMKSSRS